ncbi:MAG: hypothetical protein IJ160_14515, partial [Muribaculaceae bacterium]|nr:hypothetical protein [Muribaculaceae bacterium]
IDFGDKVIVGSKVIHDRVDLMVKQSACRPIGSATGGIDAAKLLSCDLFPLPHAPASLIARHNSLVYKKGVNV